MTTKTAYFSRRSIRETSDALDKGTKDSQGLASVVYDLMQNVNSAEDAIRRAADRIEKDAQQVKEYLANGSRLPSTSLSQNAEDLARADERRQMALTTLVGLLGQDKVAELHAAATAE